MLRFAILAAGLIAAAPAFAQNPGQSPWCRNGFFAADPSISIMQVIGTDKAYLRWDTPTATCPAAESCKHGYVLPGQRVLASRTMGEFICAYFVDSKSAGWILKSQLEPVPQPPGPRPLEDWTGHWISDVNEDSSIDITLEGASLKAEGMSYWPGRLYKQTAGMPSRHTGQFDLAGAPESGRLSLKDTFDICQITLRRLGDYLIAFDNQRCGGMNVSFTTIYVRPKIS